MEDNTDNFLITIRLKTKKHSLDKKKRRLYTFQKRNGRRTNIRTTPG